MTQGPTTGGDDYHDHQPVMAQEVVEMLAPAVPGVVIDATFGGGGHTKRLLEALEGVQVVGIDRDPEAVANAAETVRSEEVTVMRGNFGDIGRLLDEAGVDAPVGFLFDLGVSSHHLDAARRGFSYHHEGPLDMRMDPSADLTADEVVNRWEPDRLESVIRRYGEERFARRIARAIVAARPIASTTQLATIVAGATPAAARRRGHPARRTFQAIRIAVNGELDALAAGLETAIERLAPGGRCVVISYHSLEDRLVKERFAEGARACVCPPDLPVCVCDADPDLRLLTRRAVAPTAEEIAANPRARSARLRAAEKTRRAA